MREDRYDVIIVGGGLAGSAAAYTLAKAGVKVIVIERGETCGCKNMTGGRLYGHSLKRLIPDYEKLAPLERRIIKERVSLMSSDSATTVEFCDEKLGGRNAASYSVIRADLDKWLAEQAEKKGATYINGIRVDELVVRNGKVCGVRAGEDTLEANVVILADGVNSLLAVKAGLVEHQDSREYAVGAKEVIRLGEETINERFGVRSDEGVAWMFAGRPTGGGLGGGFLYTNRDTLSVGVVATVSDIGYAGTSVPDMLEEFKKSKQIAPLIEGGELVEYSAHLVPEGGAAMMPKLYGHGVMIAGDAAGMAINLGYVVRGMDFAIESGRLAAETYIELAAKHDFTPKAMSLYIATIVGAAVVMLFNWLPFIDTLTGAFVDGMFVPIRSFFFILLFGNIQAKIYSVSGAAYSVAETIMSSLLKPGASNTRKNVIAISVLLVIGIVLCMGGINASVFIVLMYPIALTIFAHCDIPKRFILGVLGACSYTFTLTMPGSPQVTNVAAMSALGTSAGVAAVPGLIGAAVEIVVIIVLLNIFINKARARGEHFELHPLDPHYDENSPRPKFIVSILPLIVLFILFNVVGVDINICIIISVVISIALFWKQLKGNSIRELLSTGAAESIHMSMTVAAICGFAGVVTNTEAFTSMLNAIVSIDISPMLICAIVVAVMCMLTGGSSTGQLISLPLIAPKLMELGLSVGAIHRIGCFAATTLDSLPYSGAILMLLPLCRMKLREVYPPLFITTVIATTCGTAAVIITCALFPGLT